MGYFVLAFAGLVDIFAIVQIIRAVRYNRITAPSSSFRTKDRLAQPFGFWASVVYYVIWLLGSFYGAFVYLS